MDVPIHDQDTLSADGLRCPGCHGCVVEVAAALRPAVCGVVPRGPDDSDACIRLLHVHGMCQNSHLNECCQAAAVELLHKRMIVHAYATRCMQRIAPPRASHVWAIRQVVSTPPPPHLHVHRLCHHGCCACCQPCCGVGARAAQCVSSDAAAATTRLTGGVPIFTLRHPPPCVRRCCSRGPCDLGNQLPAVHCLQMCRGALMCRDMCASVMLMTNTVPQHSQAPPPPTHTHTQLNHGLPLCCSAVGPGGCQGGGGRAVSKG